MNLVLRGITYEGFSLDIPFILDVKEDPFYLSTAKLAIDRYNKTVIPALGIITPFVKEYAESLLLSTFSSSVFFDPVEFNNIIFNLVKEYKLDYIREVFIND